MNYHSEPLADTVAVAAARMGISRSLFYVEARAGRVEIRKVGRRTIVARAEQERWLAALPTSRASTPSS